MPERVLVSSPLFAISGVLVDLRKRRGVTQAQLASRLGKPQSYISKSERCLRRIDPAEFRAMVMAIGADPVEEFALVSRALPPI